MRNIFNTAFLAIAMFAFASCTEKVEPQDEYLDVTANNLAGDWKAETWNDGLPMEDGVAVYIRFVRKNSRYELYSNVGSMEFTRQTGNFTVLTDEEHGYIIRGSYDNTLNEEWNHRYIVRLTSDRMVWTAYDDPADVCVYVRTSIPDDIVAAFPPVEE
ncbi:MAG: lipocalin family protein [Clostridium sp.]|nr:lipocalin family protein [Bacteroides sp.]MCM1199140.1 lipocalin family protein [Clostridium sp.]